ncbi:hypothetical protein V5799_010302 [Amblyomma americanum]|uniref:Peptidase M13 N-terminal domain-containing protein n=1 Tax=Amblyomma americanum TaxID=6943 RepID=A0AAQ4F822_AMBAM
MDHSSELDEPKQRYRQNPDDSYPSFYNSVSYSVTPEALSESLSEVVGNPTATAAEGSGANQKLALVAVGVLLFTVFVILLMRYGYPKSSTDSLPPRNICNLEPCLDYSEILRSSISDTVNPCNNFYAYVCHGVQQRGKGASILSLTRQRLIDAVLGEWLRNGSTPSEPRMPNKSVWAGRLLQMCVDQHEAGVARISELQRFMFEKNLTWPDAGASAASRDTLGTLVEMSLRWHVDVWFSLRVRHVNSSTRRPTFQLGRSESYLEWEGKRRLLLKDNTYSQILVSYLSAFGVNETKSIAESLHILEEEIAGVLAASAKISRSPRFVVLPIKDMTPNTSSAYAFDWTAALAKALGAAESEFANDAAVVESMSLLQGLNKLLQMDADRENVYALAVGWGVARDLGSFFHADLSRAYGIAGKNAVERCLNRIDELTKPALTLPLFRRTLTDELLLRVRRIFHAVQDVAIEGLDSNLWMDSGTKRRALFSARRIALVTRLPRESDLRHEGGRGVPHLDDDSQSFFQAWRTAAEHMQELTADLTVVNVYCTNEFFDVRCSSMHKGHM